MLENMLNDTIKYNNISVLLVLIIKILHKYAYLILNYLLLYKCRVLSVSTIVSSNFCTIALDSIHLFSV